MLRMVYGRMQNALLRILQSLSIHLYLLSKPVDSLLRVSEPAYYFLQHNTKDMVVVKVSFKYCTKILMLPTYFFMFRC